MKSMQSRNQALIFSVGGLQCALGLESVEHVTKAVFVTPLPGAPELVLGLINFAGRLVPVVNVRKRLGLPERRTQLSDILIILC